LVGGIVGIVFGAYAKNSPYVFGGLILLIYGIINVHRGYHSDLRKRNGISLRSKNSIEFNL
jgi:nicotinamide riboside transporter PnuC